MARLRVRSPFHRPSASWIARQRGRCPFDAFSPVARRSGLAKRRSATPNSKLAVAQAAARVRSRRARPSIRPSARASNARQRDAVEAGDAASTPARRPAMFVERLRQDEGPAGLFIGRARLQERFRLRRSDDAAGQYLALRPRHVPAARIEVAAHGGVACTGRAARQASWRFAATARCRCRAPPGSSVTRGG